MQRLIKNPISSFLVSLIASVTLGACGSPNNDDSDCPAGTEGCPCFEFTCDGALICAGNICQAADSSTGSPTSTSGDDGNDDGGSSTSGGDGDPNDPPGPTPNIDLLVVMDNSGSMSSEQQRVVPALVDLVNGLANQDGYDVRIAVTTSDNGNSNCATSGINDTSPERGNFVATPCTARQVEFEWPHSGPTVQAYNSTCLSNCPETVGAAFSIAATPVDGADGTAPRPWIEVSPGGVSNVLGVDWTEGLACVLPMGVDGCGFESQLESQWRALALSEMEASSNFGFRRAGGQLVIVHITDEADCSANPAVDQLVFDLSVMNSPFWNATVPTSAICWNAGTKCTGSGAPYDDCVSQSYNYLGNEVPDVDDPNAADDLQPVLMPMTRYVSQLDEGARPPVVFALSGVPEGYSDPSTNVVLAYQEDAATWEAFGIGYGCESVVAGEVQQAIPPVRMLELAELFGEGSSTGLRALASICASDYTTAMGALRARIVEAASSAY